MTHEEKGNLMTEKETQELINDKLQEAFDAWWANEGEDILEEKFGDEYPYNQTYELCKIAWMNGAYTRGEIN